jgi:hypothetical protein
MGREQNIRATRPTIKEIIVSNTILINQIGDRRDGSPLREINRSNGPLQGSLGTFIGQYKSQVTGPLIHGIRRQQKNSMVKCTQIV